MKIILTILLPILKSLITRVQNDAGIPPVYVVIGLVVILAVFAGIIFLIVLAVKFLIRLRNNKTKDD